MTWASGEATTPQPNSSSDTLLAIRGLVHDQKLSKERHPIVPITSQTARIRKRSLVRAERRSRVHGLVAAMLPTRT